MTCPMCLLSTCETLEPGNCVITGSNGFVGSHLAEFLAADPSYRVHAIFHTGYQALAHLKDVIVLHKVDMADRTAILKVLTECKPDKIFHLAAVSSVLHSWRNPSLHFDINVNGTINLLEAARETGIDSSIIVTCSSAEYDSTSQGPLREDSPLRPTSPYAVSKLAQDFLAELYANTYGLKVIRVRPFLIIGPRRLTGACADFAKGIVGIERGVQEKVHVGNLNPVVDVLDVRDAVSGLVLLAEHGEKGKVYNLCSGKGYSIKLLLNMMTSLAQRRVEILVDPRKFRPQDETALIGDNSRLRQLGWKPEIPIETTLKDILSFWRIEFTTAAELREELATGHE